MPLIGDETLGMGTLTRTPAGLTLPSVALPFLRGRVAVGAEQPRPFGGREDEL